MALLQRLDAWKNRTTEVIQNHREDCLELRLQYNMILGWGL